LAQFYQTHQDPTILKDFYESMVVPMATFLVEFVDSATGLPKPSYDLWEEVYMTTTYTVATTYGALIAASDLASAANDEPHAVEWRTAALDIQAAARRHLYNHERKVFYKGLTVRDGQMIKDATIDTSAIFGAYQFGLVNVTDEEMTHSITSTRAAFDVIDKAEKGLPRYENDNYRREDPSLTGNWWFITSLWLVQYDFANGNQEQAMKRLDWLQSLALPTGMLSEQIDPKTNEQISPSPLAWSQAEYVSTLLDIISEKA